MRSRGKPRLAVVIYGGMQDLLSAAAAHWESSWRYGGTPNVAVSQPALCDRIGGINPKREARSLEEMPMRWRSDHRRSMATY